MNDVEELAQLLVETRKGLDRAGLRRWARMRQQTSVRAMVAQRDAKRHKGDHEKAAEAASLTLLDMACTRALVLESQDRNEIASPPEAV